MYIKNIVLNNFRNFSHLELSFNKKINFIVGDNAQGKTNLIESFYYASLGKSFRTKNNIDLIKLDKNFLNIIVYISDNKVINKLNVNYDKNQKKILLNGKKPERYDYLNLIIFHPEELNLLISQPNYRRNLIDRSIFYNDHDYINLHKKYIRCLKQRNTFLKKVDKKNKDIWKDHLIILGSEIIRKRLQYIERINTYINSINLYSKNNESFKITYTFKSNNKDIENYLFKEFENKKDREIFYGYTIVGPHRDDFVFEINDKKAGSFASQGQKKSILIAYKTAQLMDYNKNKKSCPILLLDDLSSELDNLRKNKLLESLLDNSQQVFITTTDLSEINLLKDKSTIFNVNNGNINISD